MIAALMAVKNITYVGFWTVNIHASVKMTTQEQTVQK